MHPVILFDGYCKLCNATVNFIIRNDKKKLFRFAALQSEASKNILSVMELSAKPYDITRQISAGNVDSVILIYKNEIYIESDAGLKIALLLGFPWNAMCIFGFIPQKIRNRIYRWIANNRYKWFGKKASCRIPASNEKELFLTNQHHVTNN